MYMKKKSVRRKKMAGKNWLFLIKSWMFVVMFALMLGVGAIVGSFINSQMNPENTQVAGASIQR